MAKEISQITGDTPIRPGLVAFFGSGETSASGRRIFDHLFKHLSHSPKIAVLETPAGFELNSSWVAGQVADFLTTRLQTYTPELHVIPARKKGTSFSPDNLDLLDPMLDAAMLYLGAGSPTYAVRHLQETWAWHILQIRHRMETSVVFASASTLAAGAYTIPVYEIYKVGEDVHWKKGLDFFGPFGLNLIFIPHWNNTDGGETLDTSHCYMGTPRFETLYELLPDDVTVVGIEEHTAVIFDFAQGSCHVMGRDGAVILQKGIDEKRYKVGSSIPLSDLGDFRLPEWGDGVPSPAIQYVNGAIERLNKEKAALDVPSKEVLELFNLRQEARKNKDWGASDQYRARIKDYGWDIRDTPTGSVLELRENH